MPRRAEPTPRRLETARVRFEDWRAGRRRGERIPEQLWSQAVQLANEFGLYRTSNTLRLDYATLKRRAGACDEPAAKPRVRRGFVEVAGPMPATLGGCTIEIEGPKGQKLRLELPSVDPALLTSIARGFLRDE